jgi:hypothetical protein
VVFLGSDALPYAPNAACPFPPVNIFFKSFPTISQSDAAQRLDVHFFCATIDKRRPKKRERTGESWRGRRRDGANSPTPRPRSPVVGESRGMYPLPSPSLSPTPYTTHYTLHPAPYTTLCTLHTTHYTTPCTLHPALHTAGNGGRRSQWHTMGDA